VVGGVKCIARTPAHVTEVSAKQIIERADAALYRAKADGRDRACRATDFRAAA